MRPADEFLEIAGMVGHDTRELAAGAEISTYGTFPNIYDAARMFCRATPAERAERLRHFFNPPIAARSRLGQGVHDRGEAAGLAGFVLSEEDEKLIAHRMPAHYRAVSVQEKIVRSGEVWDLSMRGDPFGLDYQRELYSLCNVGRLILEPGATLVVRGNIFALVCQRIEVQDSGAPYHIGILPTPFSVDYRFGPLHGIPGTHGGDGARGADGKEMHVRPAILGNILSDDIEQCELNGAHGEDGRDGSPGATGRNGGMCHAAEITMHDIRGEVTLFVQAGAGGDGGDGGDGGAGGDGGHGARAFPVIRGLYRGGDGGQGGNGGNGARGGHGGSGGIASNVYIRVPRRLESQVRAISLPSKPGAPGQGGLPGAGGRGGAAGAGPRPEHNGSPGSNGSNGKPGFAGRPGRSRPAPYVFLNEAPVSEQISELITDPTTERMQDVEQVEFS